VKTRKKHRNFFSKHRAASFFYSAVLLFMLIFLNGCMAKGNMAFNPPVDSESFIISGNLSVKEIVNTDLLKPSIKEGLAKIKDFSVFKVYAGELSAPVSKTGSFKLAGVPFSDDLVLRAKAEKLEFLLRISPHQLLYTNLGAVEINIQSTAEAMIYLEGKRDKKNLTPADIKAREYEADVYALRENIRKSLMLADEAVKDNVLEVPVVKETAYQVSAKILEREAKLRDANSALFNSFRRKDVELLKKIVSPSFSNDWDPASSWTDLLISLQEVFKNSEFATLNNNILDLELLPNNRARIRTKTEALLKSEITDHTIAAGTWISDTEWSLEGTAWKVLKNLPYKKGHPLQPDADGRWGEVAQAHRDFLAAGVAEEIDKIKNAVSLNFTNDFDMTSTYNDFIVTTQRRFNFFDVKDADYKIEKITFTADNEAEVKCSGFVTAYSYLMGTDVKSGNVTAVITWRKEDGSWKIYRNLPYKFTHPLNR